MVRNYPRPDNAKKLRSFLGFVCYYHRFIKNCAEILQPLHKLASNNKSKRTSLTWNPQAIDSFNRIKSELSSQTLLVHPHTSAPLSLLTDASKDGMGGVLQQFVNGVWQPLGFFSKAFNTAQRKYTTFDRELLAAYSAVRHFNSHLKGRKFQLISDNAALVKSLKNPTERLLDRQHNQLDFISQYTDDIRHLPGSLNCAADTLSRLGINSLHQQLGINSIKLPETISVKEFYEAQHSDNELAQLLQSDCSHSLDLFGVPYPQLGGQIIIFDQSQADCPRPYVPSTLRERLFDTIHGLAHPGIRGTIDLISKRFVWPHMKRDITNWVRECHSCQKSKITRHTRSAIHSIPIPSKRFHAVNVDILGPLEYSHGFTYILMCIDRFSRWPECIPITDIKTDTLINAFVYGWISRFGVPHTIITDRGAQFCSSSWKDLMSFLGIEHKTTLAYKPEQNSLVERFNRTLKTALRCMEDSSNWYEHLGFVLLGLRSTLKEDIGLSTSELVYGTTLHLPGQLVDPDPCSPMMDPYTYVNKLKRYFAALQPIPTRVEQAFKSYIPKDLQHCTHVYLRIERKKKALEPVYTGPHRVLTRSSKAFTIELDRGSSDVSIDRLKPAFLPFQHFESSSPMNEGSRSVKHSEQLITAVKPISSCAHSDPQTSTNDEPALTMTQNRTSVPANIVTRSGRQIRPPRWLRDYCLSSLFTMDL